MPRLKVLFLQPLASYIDVGRILATPHSSSQVANIWTMYHNSRSAGTGRGFLSATIPTATYEQMIGEGSKFPSFILPLHRMTSDGQSSSAFEFYFLEWSFYHSPVSVQGQPHTNPRISTILFTSLAEYKLRQSYAQPHLVITHYTDLVQTHGIVLMRGELTPIPKSITEYRLSQEEAQMLALGVQRFYLPGGRDEGQTKLLKSFHEQRDKFKWEELVSNSGRI